MPAAAQEARDLCGDRPGLNEAGCIVDAGRLQLESGVSWTRISDGPDRSDTFALGETALRYGLDPRTELRLEFTAFGILDARGSGSAEGVGDLTLGFRRNLVNPDGSGFSAAVQPFVTLPTGSGPFDSGDWSAGVALPFGFELGPTISFAATPQIVAAADADGDGRHLSYGASAGFGFALSEAVTALADISVIEDDDPAGSSTEALAGLALAWQTSPDVQLDIGAAAGLNRESPDVQVYAGFVKRF